MSTISVVGTGYVGLVTGACFADLGNRVTCIDVDERKVGMLRNGAIPIYEPGLEEIVERNVRAGRLAFTTSYQDGLSGTEFVFIAVNTPPGLAGEADMTYVRSAAHSIAEHLQGPAIVVNKSTMPIGTGDWVQSVLDRNGSVKTAVVSNPEFLREGAAIGDFKHPDRIVIGGEDERGLAAMREVYRPLFLGGKAPLVEMSRRGAELTKYAGNAFLATKITFINEIADLCEKVGADVRDVARGIGLDNRIGGKFLNAGPGYGGSCFPKDTLALIKTAQDYEAPQRIVETVAVVNDNRKRAMGRKVIAACDNDVRGKRIAILGLTFKPNTDDMRDSPAIAVIQTLQDAGAEIHACDPEGVEQAKKVLDNVTYHANPWDALAGASAAVIVTEWDAYRALDMARLAKALAEPVLVDLRNIYDRATAEAAGLRYSAVGR